jgi:lipopolysaccharide transport system permease protein
MDHISVTHIRRGARWQALGFGDIWQYRGLLFSLGLRDVKLRYKQTLLGVAWVVLQPLLSAGILTAVFGLIAAVPSPEGVPYFAIAYLGQMGWSLFSLTVTRTSGSMVGNIALVMKIYFPRPILPLATILAVLLDFAISFAIAIPLLVMYGTGVVNIPVVLVAGLALVLCAAGVGFLLATISVRFRDVIFVLPFIVQLGLYASPVAYQLEFARRNLEPHSHWYFVVYMLNPLASLVEAFRWGLLGRGLFLPGYFAYGVVASVGIFLVGFCVFRASEGKFPDVI